MKLAIHQSPGRRCALALVSCVMFLLSACATPPQTRALLAMPPSGIAAARHLDDIPFFAQDEYQCGPAALAMALSHSGLSLRPEELVAEVYVPARQGSFQVEMLASARRHGRLALPVSPSLQALLAWVDSGEPVLVLQNLGPDWYPVWHYAVVVGYDLVDEAILLHSGEIENYRVAMGTFEQTWARSAYWGMVTLVPGELPYRDDAASYFKAAAALEETRPVKNQAAVWRAGVEAWPEEPDMRMGAANASYRTGDEAAALAQYQALLEAFPGYLPAYNNLASLLLQRGELEQALSIAARGLREAGGSNAYLEQTLAEIRERQDGPRHSP